MAGLEHIIRYMQPTLHYLALGDSYTVGEQVPIYDSFPYQLVQQLRKNQSLPVAAPEILAKTGWTTDELLQEINKTKFLTAYDFVTLLIGVNNQYRGRSITDFEKEFEELLNRAIEFAGGNPQKVFVVSIPDWGVTPFAAERDSATIAKEIDAYNEACMRFSNLRKSSFVNITISQRADGNKDAYLTTDKLHPSGKEYEKWAKSLASLVLKKI